jgi:hypothetical protein
MNQYFTGSPGSLWELCVMGAKGFYSLIGLMCDLD